MGTTDQLSGSEKALEADFVENSSAQPPYIPPRKAGFGSKVKRHCVRFWWLHIIIFCICFLIIALCLVYVGLPRIAQHDVNKSHLELTDLKFLNPTPESLSLTQAAILHNPSTFTPTLDPFYANSFLVANGSYAAQPMVKILMPRIHSLHPKSDAVAELQICPILNHDAVNNYVSAVLTQEFVTSALVGETKLHIGSLPVTDIKYNTSLTYKGLNGLKGFNVTETRVNLTAGTGVPNLKGIAFVPNPSVITVEMGNVTLALSAPKLGVIGNATILNMTLKPGDNHLPLTGFFDTAKVASNLVNGHFQLTITGQESVYNGQHLTYFEQALSRNELYLDLNVVQVLADSLKAA